MEQPGTLPSGDFPVRGCRGQIRAYIKRERRNTHVPDLFFPRSAAGRIREHTPHYGKEENTPLKTQYKILALVLALFCLLSFPCHAVLAAEPEDGEFAEDAASSVEEAQEEEGAEQPELTVPLAKAPMLKAAAATALITFDYVYDSAGQYVYYQHPFYYNGGPTGGYGDMRLNDFANGQEAYCIEPGIMLAHGDVLRSDVIDVWNSFSYEQQNAIKLALLCGRAGNSSNLPGTPSCQQTATQMLIWELVTGARQPSPPYTRGNDEIYTCLVSNGQNAEIGQIYDTILSYMLSYMTLPSFMTAVSSSAPQEELSYDGTTYSITLTDTNNVIGNYSFTASDTAVSAEVSGNQLILRSASPLSAPVTVVATRNSAYTAASTFTPYGSTTRQDIVVGVEAVGGMTGYLTLKANHKEFRITVTKEDSLTGMAQGDGTLAGAVYGLYHSDTLIETCTTDANGQFTTGYYEAGEGWTIREIAPSPGYLLDTTVYPIPAATDQLPSIKNDLTLTVKETPILGRFSISKLAVNSAAGTEAPETGATFEVFPKSAGSYDAAAETERDILTCGEDGTAQSKLLPYGVYIVRQLSGWEGYALDTTRHEVNISSDGETVSIQLRNEIFKGSLTIRKVDMDTEQALLGARFRLLDSTGNPFAEGMTDANGILLFEDIPFGDYYLEELEAPDGYKADTTPYVFSVTADGQKIEIRRENTRIPGSVTVAKTDSGGNPIPGAAFRLEYSEDGEIWTPVFHADVPAKEIGGCTSESLSDGMLITGDDGIAVFGGLRADKNVHYRITEIATVNGYVLLTEPVELGTLPRESEESTIYNVSVTISNSPTYLLPMTGGAGLWPVLSAGFAAACMGLFLIIVSKNKRRDCMQ